MTGRVATVAKESEPIMMETSTVSGPEARVSEGPKTPATPPLSQPSDQLATEPSETSSDVILLTSSSSRPSLDQRIESFRQKAVAHPEWVAFKAKKKQEK